MERAMTIHYDPWRAWHEAWLAQQEQYKSHLSGLTARSVFGQRKHDSFLRGYLEDAELTEPGNESGHEDWRDADELDDDQ